MRAAVAVVLATGCGRVAFDPIADAFTQDAFELCIGGDGTCPLACVATDADCQTTCGDGRCVGNAGELCGNCTADCATTQLVCGNARCEAGEAADCYADCGPVPWQWNTQETNLFNSVNNARKNGVICPGDTAKRFAPVLTLLTDPVTKNAAREWAWELAHHQFSGDPGQDGETCTNETFAQRRSEGKFTSAVVSFNATGAADAVNRWKGIASVCQIMMSKTVTRGLAGVAIDADPGWVLLMD